MIMPTTAEFTDLNRAGLEARLNQKTPPAAEAFNNAIATLVAMGMTSLAKYAQERARANLVATAIAADLDALGAEADTPRKLATACELTASLPCDDGTVVPLGRIFQGPQGLQYETLAAAIAPSGASGSGASLSLVCRDSGTAGNLALGDALALQSPIAGASADATVAAVAALGTEREEDDDYRVRILDAQRSELALGAPSWHRVQAQAVAGVARAYPFSGPPEGSGLTPRPVMRTVYVESTPAINADGIAPQTLLDSVRAALLIDPDSGLALDLLGLPSDGLYVRAMTRIPIYVRVVGLTIGSGTLAAAQADIEAALAVFLRQFRPFVQGVDPDFDKLNELTTTPLSRVVQDVLDAYGGRAQNVLFSTTPGGALGTYALKDNELAKLGSVTYESA